MVNTLLLKFNYEHTELEDGVMGVVYRWKFENGYGVSLIDLFSYYKRAYGESYEVALLKYNQDGSFNVVDNDELMSITLTSDIYEVNRILTFVNNLNK